VPRADLAEERARRLLRLAARQGQERVLLRHLNNLDNSFDSRILDFGPVTADMVRGKPLHLYWSPTRSRIGCSFR